MRSRTIIEAVSNVLSARKSPLTAEEIYRDIIERKLYDFKAKDPISVMRSAIRKHLRIVGSAGPISVCEDGTGRYRIVFAESK